VAPRLCLQARIRAGLLVVCLALSAAVHATPQFARETGLACASCHSFIPRLNAYGQKFFANGFRMPDIKKKPTVPAWAAIAAEASSPEEGSNAVPISWDDTSIASAEAFMKGRLLYHVHWMPVAHELELSAIGRISDHVAISAGRQPMISQYDPGLSVSESELGALAPVINALDEDDLDPSHHPFGASSDAMSVRLVAGTGSPLPYAEGWTVSATVPFSNVLGDSEDGIPFDVQSDPRGVYLEAYRRLGVNSLGVSSFFGKDGRRFYGFTGQHKLGDFYVEAAASYASTSIGSGHAYSASVDWTPKYDKSLGLRVDKFEDDTTYTPYAGVIIGNGPTAFKLLLATELASGERPATTLSATFRF
jgi:hypothetical protein